MMKTTTMMVLLGLLVCSCTHDLVIADPPTDTKEVCTEDADCEGDLICNENWGICVVADCAGQDDFTPCEVITDPDRAYDICVDEVCVSPGCGDASCNTPGPHFPLPDTGQRQCYDLEAAMTCTSFPCDADGGPEFCGQDAQYGWDTKHDAAERFTRDLAVAGEPVVTDNVTGLIWQGCARGLTGDTCNSGEGEMVDWNEALAYCDALEWGGHSDWRLPDLYESLSIIDFGKVSWPTIDSTAFPFTPVIFQSTSSTLIGNENKYWASNLQFAAIDGQLKSKKDSYVRCIRGMPKTQSSRFEIDFAYPNSDRIVIDKTTGLIWQGCIAGKSGPECVSGALTGYNWLSALSYCEGLTWGGATDWRLPNIMELMSIHDHRICCPAIDETTFPLGFTYNWSEVGFWSSSSTTLYSVHAVNTVFVEFGDLGASDKNGSLIVRCVRGGM